MKATETYEEKKIRAAHLFLDGKCSLNMAIAVVFKDSKEAFQALTDLKKAFH